MFSLFRSKAAEKTESTFKVRVRDFWQWYAEVAPRFLKTIREGNCAQLASEVTERTDRLYESCAWVFGPGLNGGESLTLSGEGELHRQLLVQFWHSQAPSLDGWTFYAARQPRQVRGIGIKVDGRKFLAEELWISPIIDAEEEKVNITAWHPLFGVLEKKDCYQPLFLFLDEALGEYGTGQWIGEINLSDQKLAEAIPLEELAEYLKRLTSEKGWKKEPPGKAAITYRLNQPGLKFLRGDILVGTTMHPALIDEYIRDKGELSDPLAGTGADYVFVALDIKFWPKEKLIEIRGDIEDALESRLRRTSSGRLLGGATGRTSAYIDLLVFDGQESIKLIRDVLIEKNLPSGTAIHFFAKEKRGHRIIL